MTALLAALAGLLLGWLLASSRRLRRRHPFGLRRRLLLRWIEDAPIGWLILDGMDRAHLVNARAERLLDCGLLPSPTSRSLADVCPSPQLLALVRHARARQRLQRLQWNWREQDLEAFALPAENGWVAVLIQSRRSLEAQLEQQERWVSDVAHELKTPLTALLLVGESLAERAEGRSVVLVQRLQRELLRLQRLVGDLLELTRLENALPGQAGDRERLDLSQLVEQAWSVLRPIADERAVQLSLQADGPVPLRGDPSRLQRALLNLLDNAVRHSPDGGTVSVGLESDGVWCQLSVRDRGPGLGPEDPERIFERFYRGDSSRSRQGNGGTGLGLSIVKQIVVTHGGRVQASDHPEGGALIEVFLPVGL